MNNRAAATRYAQALFDVTESSARSALDTELAGVAEFVTGKAELQAVLSNPSVAASVKRGVVQELAKRGNASPAIVRLLTLLAERDRLGLLADVAAVFHGLVLDDQRILQAEVTTAEPLSDDERRAIAARLSAATTKQVTLTTHVAPEIIGGIVTKIGSTVYDGSLANQLARVRERLASN